MVTPDGLPLVWLSRLNGQTHVERLYGPDLLLACCERLLTPEYRLGVKELLSRSDLATVAELER